MSTFIAVLQLDLGHYIPRQRSNTMISCDSCSRRPTRIVRPTAHSPSLPARRIAGDGMHGMQSLAFTSSATNMRGGSGLRNPKQGAIRLVTIGLRLLTNCFSSMRCTINGMDYLWTKPLSRLPRKGLSRSPHRHPCGGKDTLETWLLRVYSSHFIRQSRY